MSESPSLAEQYNAKLSILCESEIPALVYFGIVERVMNSDDLFQDICLKIPRNRRKISDDEIRTLINQPPRKPEPGPLDDPLRDAPKNQGELESVPPAIKTDTSNKPIIESLNKNHAVIMLAGKCLILNRVIDPTTNRPDINFSSIQDFKARYQNRKTIVERKGRADEISIADEWLNSPNRKEYHGIVFDPSNNEKDGVYNLWQGFAVQPKKGSWKLMQDHLRSIICSDDPEAYQYLIPWLARLVQDPGGNRPGVVPVLRGKQGVGKGIFVNNFGKICGSHFKHIISHHLVAGRFNSHFKDALLVFVDEGFWGGDKQAEGILKGMVTEDYIVVEPKGKEAFTIKMHANFIFASNSDWIVPAATEERRFFTIDVSSARMGDAEYFKRLSHEMENGGREAMLYDLLHHDITGVDLRAFPRREALLDQILNTWPADKKFWFEVLRSGYINTSSDGSSVWPDVIDCDDLYLLYSDFATHAGERFKSIDKVFGRKLKEICPSIVRKQRGNGRRYYSLPSLDKCRNDLETLIRIKIKWNE
jgi:hypothetical protein